MYKILIKTCSASNNIWNFYQEDGVDYVAASLEDMKPTALTLLKKYGKKNIKIIDQMSGQDMDNADVYIYDSTDNYEELSNRPYINGTEIVGQLTLEDLGIQPAGDYLNQNDLEEIENKINNMDLSAYATNTRVDEVEAQIENIDLTPYATKEFVSEEISNIDIPETDLSGYATEEYVDDAIAGIDIPEVDLTDYATTQYVEDLLANSNGLIDVEATTIDSDTFHNMKTGDVYRIVNSNTRIYYNGTLSISTNYANALLIGSTFPLVIDGNLVTCLVGSSKYVLNMTKIIDADTVLTKTNTTSFTPTNNYHPATKKYVDDAVANAGGGEELFHCIKFEHQYANYIFSRYDTPNNVEYMTTEQSQMFADYINECIQGTSPLKTSKPLALDIDSNLIFTTSHGNGYNSSGAHTFTFTFVTPVQGATSGGISDKSKLKLKFTTFEIYLKYENGVYSAVDDFKSYFMSRMYEDYLALNNSKSYTPTNDYHPATKKYVDDAVAGASGGSGGEANLTNYYTKAEVDALLQELRNEFVSANNNINDKLETIIYGGE